VRLVTKKEEKGEKVAEGACGEIFRFRIEKVSFVTN